MSADIQSPLTDGGITMKKKKTFSAKLNKAEKIVQVLTIAVVVAVTVYSLIPKSDKIKEVDAQALADRFNNQPNEDSADEAATMQ